MGSVKDEYLDAIKCNVFIALYVNGSYLKADFISRF